MEVTRTVTPVPSNETAASSAERQKIVQLAQEFESMLISQMLSEMRRSMLDEEGEGEGLGRETFTDTLDVEVARAMSQQGGLGFAQVVQKDIERLARPAASRQEVTTDVRPTVASGSATGGASPAVAPYSTAPPAGVAVPPSVPAASEPSAQVALPLDSAVTSPFGWRQDPFHGRSRFHSGVDLRAAYGQDVPAAASGTVEFAGTQGGYGQTVVVAHGNGLRTRYAHLSSLNVEAGQRIAAGTLVGRAGSSGRSTAPHLHFEVTQDGARVDPMTIAGRIPGGLKEMGSVVDFPFDRVPLDSASGVNHED